MLPAGRMMFEASLWSRLVDLALPRPCVIR